MLMWLSVHNFALIENAKIEFDDKFNVFTGETGAGKSIVLDAVGAVLGFRASNDYIRVGCDYFRVQAAFDIAKMDEVKAWLSERGIDTVDNELILSRRFSKNGKNIINVNDVQITIGSLRQLGEMLVDIQAQHSNQLLLGASYHLQLLDFYAGVKMQELLSDYKNTFNDYKNIEQQIVQTMQRAQEREQKMDILKWQIQEIESAKLKEHEYEKLQAESKRLANAEKIRTALKKSYGLLNETAAGHNLLDMLCDLYDNLTVVAKYEDKFVSTVETLKEWQYVLEDIKSDLSDYYEKLDEQPYTIEQLQKRIDVLYKLQKKYGDYNQTIEFLQNAKQQYQELMDIEEDIKSLDSQKNTLMANLQQQATAVSAIRAKTAAKLIKELKTHITDLAMPKAVFEIAINRKSDYGIDGMDEVVFMFSANPGQTPKPLQKVASGGELSRIFLALRTVLGRNSDITMVFDEIDTGVSGITAQRMAEKLVLISKNRQVICVTHLPQVACMADRHIYVSKEQSTDTTHTKIENLDMQGRIDNITQMMAGAATELAKDSATQLIVMADERKRELRQ